MAAVKIHFGQVHNGKFEPFDRLSFIKDFARHEGKVVGVTVDRKKEFRSLDQNAYLWGVVYEIISEETGMLSEEVHEAMKLMFLRKEVSGIETVRSTATLTKEEMARFIDDIIAWAISFLGAYIPSSNAVML